MDTDLYRTADHGVRLEAVLVSLASILLAYLVGIVLASLGVSVAASAGYTTESAPVVVYALRTSLTFGGFVLAAGGYLVISDGFDLVHVRRPTLRDAGWIVVGFLALLVASAVLSEIVAALGVETAQNQVIIEGRENPVLFLLLLPITVLFVAPGEELVFRGIVQGQFRRAYGALPGIAVASLLFGVSHSGALTGSGQLTYLAVATILGLILGVLYEHTETVLVPIGIHAAWNCFLYASEWLRVVHGIALPV